MKGRIMIAALSMMTGALVLGGCGSKDDGEQAGSGGAPKSAEEVKHEAAKLDTPQPGQYRQTVEITRLEVPGMPKEAAEQMKSMMAAKQESTICLTRADAEKGYRDMFRGVGKGNECSYSKFDVDGGRLDAQMDCQSAGDGKSTMTLNGTVRRDGSDVTVDMDTTGGPAPTGSMKMTIHLTTTRLGDCKT
ncbi:hypothetical protein LH128_21810 [Sphingomonas sp. LH128]|uniref:DUF3617 domain-containing protein n=2 Tax=Sphingomonadales TaxID=204457 RepID=A0A031JT74_9SPHN|nr:hypothetical protein LH128_21810 [Sphingomonas sp. LH128]EZP79572.1 hypothetical protein BV97_04010 [Novosphingobium resinovorum]